MDVDAAINAVIAREGGYADHPADKGGPTCWGITQAVARADGYAGAMAALPRARAAAIYRRLYWTGPGLDAVGAIAPAVAGELLDAGINMGSATALRFLQRGLNALNRGGRDYPDVPADGRAGGATLAALRAFLRARGAGGEAVLVKAMQGLRAASYVQLAEARPADEAFLYGWLAKRG